MKMTDKVIKQIEEAANISDRTTADVAGSLLRATQDGFLTLNNLQFFSADPGAGGAGAGQDTPPPEGDELPPEGKKPDETPPEPPKTFTQEELDDIVAKRVARAEKDKQKAIDEAKKLAKMNADEKQQYEFEKLQKENEQLKIEKNRYSLGREATKMLSESGITADDDVLDFVVREDAEATKLAVQAFSALVQSKVDDAVRVKLKGTPPKASNGGNAAMTKESIMSIKDSATRIKAIQENPQLFN